MRKTMIFENRNLWNPQSLKTAIFENRDLWNRDLWNRDDWKPWSLKTGIFEKPWLCETVQKTVIFENRDLWKTVIIKGGTKNRDYSAVQKTATFRAARENSDYVKNSYHCRITDHGIFTIYIVILKGNSKPRFFAVELPFLVIFTTVIVTFIKCAKCLP